MVRMIISLPQEDKQWLDAYSRHRRQSAEKTVRGAVADLRKNSRDRKNNTKALDRAFGLWRNKKIDALDLVRSLRSEWAGR